MDAILFLVSITATASKFVSTQRHPPYGHLPWEFVVPRGCKVTERARKLRRHVHGVHVRRTFDRVRHSEPCTQKHDVITLIAHTYGN